jgi:hypothetical protein
MFSVKVLWYYFCGCRLGRPATVHGE